MYRGKHEKQAERTAYQISVPLRRLAGMQPDDEKHGDASGGIYPNQARANRRRTP